MRTIIRKLPDVRLLVTLIGIAVSFAGPAVAQTPQPKPADFHAYYLKGQAQAEADVKSGVYAIQSWGLAEATLGEPCSFPSQAQIKDRILTEKYKIKFESVGGCMPLDEDIEFARGYNEAMQHALNARYGEDVFAKADTEAAKESNEQNKDRARQCADWLEAIRTLPTRRP